MKTEEVRGQFSPEIALTHSASSESSIHASLTIPKKKDFQPSFTSFSTTTLTDAVDESPERAKLLFDYCWPVSGEDIFRLDLTEDSRTSVCAAWRPRANLLKHRLSVVISIRAGLITTYH